MHIGAERVNDSNSCKLILFKSARVAGAKRGGEGRGGEEKGEEYFPHYPPLLPVFHPC